MKLKALRLRVLTSVRQSVSQAVAKWCIKGSALTDAGSIPPRLVDTPVILFTGEWSRW